MLRKRIVCGLVGLLLLAALAAPSASNAQRDGVQARTHYALPVYSEANRASTMVGVLVPQTDVYLEARSADAAWLLGHSLDGTVRGWLEARYLDVSAETDVTTLLFSAERMFISGEQGYASGEHRRIDLNAFPVIPAQLGDAPSIFARGRANGAQAQNVAKVGDCISDNRHFLSPFGWNAYSLGGYTQLQDVIDYYAVSLATDSLAAYDGLVTTAVLDPLFANPMICQPGESPLRCEYRVHQPSVSIIMFGAQDLLFTPADAFDRNLRRIVHETIQAGVVPIVSTFPGNLSRWDQAVEYNQIVVQVALDYNVPLMNLWRALEALPNHGLDEDGRHLSAPITSSGDLTGDNLRRGYPARNLVTLQALDTVWRGLTSAAMSSP